MAAGLRRPVGPGSGCGAGGWRVACGTRGAGVGGDPWRQDRGGVARAGPSVQPVGSWWADDPWRAAAGVAPGVPPVVAWRVRPRAAARCGRAPGAGDPGDPSVRPVGRWPTHGAWRRAHHPPRGAQPGDGLRVPGRVRPGALPARLTTACSGPRWRGSLGWAQFWCPAGQLTPNRWVALRPISHCKAKWIINKNHNSIIETISNKGRGNIYSSQMRRWRNGYKPFA